MSARESEGAPERRLAIVCGGGTLPLAVADAVTRRGRPVVLFPIKGWADPQAVAGHSHRWIAIGQLGRLQRLAAQESCREMVWIGTVLRPSLRQIRLDLTTLRELPRILAAFRGGDDHLLTMLGRIFEEHGLKLVGAHEVAPEILARDGALGRLTPGDRDRADIARALAVLAATGPYDIGQAAVVADNHVLALEAAEGTDNMLARIADLRLQGRVRSRIGTGVLVKAAKAGQDRRFDLPSIGPQTIAGVAGAGLAGLAVVAGDVIIAEPQRVAVAADAAKVFVAGVGRHGSA
ncbi:MAG TPA: UDP-2,3-diacylglucosamine diphosphatase LpxI [Xanthobacteraceae bacterium]|nr:UDP-2,3-diacylglucosamine diphosphatase LpxI [Xanthobacteraceae bacterium]